MAKIKITLVKSKIGSDKTQVGTIQALGLKKTNSSVEKEATPQILWNGGKNQPSGSCGRSKISINILRTK